MPEVHNDLGYTDGNFTNATNRLNLLDNLIGESNTNNLAIIPQPTGQQMQTPLFGNRAMTTPFTASS